MNDKNYDSKRVISPNEPNEAFSGSFTETKPIVYSSSRDPYREGFTIAGLIQGFFMFFFGLPFIAAPVLVATAAFSDLGGIGIKIFIIIFIIPFLFVGCIMSLSGILIVISFFVKKPIYTKVPLIRKYYKRKDYVSQPPVAPPQPSMHYCMYCGAKIPPNATHCPQCGSPVDE